MLSGMLAALALAGSERAVGQDPRTPAERVAGTLGFAANRQELARLSAAIPGLLNDSRLQDQSVRDMLVSTRTVLGEVLDAGNAEHSWKLLEFQDWMVNQGLQQAAIRQQPGGTSKAAEQFVLENPLAGGSGQLVVIVAELLQTSLEAGLESTPPENLEAFLQIYLRYPKAGEFAGRRFDALVFDAPKWTAKRFVLLSDTRKRQAAKDLQYWRSERAGPLHSDQDFLPAPDAAKQAAYDSACQEILAATPAP